MPGEMLPTDIEKDAIHNPRLIHGLLTAAKNGLVYFGDYLDPDPDSGKPKRRPNFELNEWLGRLNNSGSNYHED
jgi:hypothetical protein